jgi:DUF1009 family protein
LVSQGFADDGFVSEFGGVQLSVGQLGKLIQLMRKEGCEEMVFAGWLKRPDFSTLKLDLKGIQSLPRILAAAKKGDDALLRAVMDVFAEAGFRIIGADDVLDDLRVGAGPLGRVAPRQEHWADIRRAAEVASVSGSLEIGQGAVSCDGPDPRRRGPGGDRSHAGACPGSHSGDSRHAGGAAWRAGEASETAAGTAHRPPTIGVRTVAGAAAAGLAGIAVEAGAALVVDREAVARAADKAGIFIYGFTLAELA